MKTRTVQDVEVPTFLYGTAWKEDRTEELVKEALEAGFRGIDTANQRKHYHEAGVGAALEVVLVDGSDGAHRPDESDRSDRPDESGRPEGEGHPTRDDLFLQTKFTYAEGQDHRLPYDAAADYPTQVRQSFESSLEHLGVERLDSYILHGPRTRMGLGEPDRQVWRTMEELQREGRVGLIGISNVSAGQVATLCELAEVRPAFVQNRCFARTGWDRETRRVCRDLGIAYQGFSLLTANRTELASPEVRRIAGEHGKTLPQVVFRFALQLGMICLTGTTDPEHMRQDLAVYDFELADEAVETIEGVSG